MNERDQVLSFLLNAVEAKNRIIEELQKKIAELSPKVDAAPPAPPASA